MHMMNFIILGTIVAAIAYGIYFYVNHNANNQVYQGIYSVSNNFRKSDDLNHMDTNDSFQKTLLGIGSHDSGKIGNFDKIYTELVKKGNRLFDPNTGNIDIYIDRVNITSVEKEKSKTYSSITYKEACEKFDNIFFNIFTEKTNLPMTLIDLDKKNMESKSCGYILLQQKGTDINIGLITTSHNNHGAVNFSYMIIQLIL